MNSKKTLKVVLLCLCVVCGLTACELEYTPPDGGASLGDNDDSTIIGDENGRVVSVIDGDTIDVEIDGTVYRVRYVGVNTPERSESCYSEARRANIDLVEGQTVTLVRDRSETDRYDRLLRYVYVGNTFVNAELIRNGYAEVVLYQPDDAQFDFFVDLERDATDANAGCHASGIFDDGTYER